MARLFVVSTPIGNLEDLTERARRVLGEVQHILAEDTRRTGRLLVHIGRVSARLTSLHAHNEAARVQLVLEWLERGHDVALVSDAGTPLVSDPGVRVVRAVSEAGHDVVPVPGPSAVLAALVASGQPGDRFTFLGFMPRKGPDRREAIGRVAEAQDTVVMFESPERLVRLLVDLVAACGRERQVAVGRELTKLHETVLRGTLSDALLYYQTNAARGEVTVVVSAHSLGAVGEDVEGAKALARELLAGGSSASSAAGVLAERLGLARNAAYRLVQDVKES